MNQNKQEEENKSLKSNKNNNEKPNPNIINNDNSNNDNPNNDNSNKNNSNKNIINEKEKEKEEEKEKENEKKNEEKEKIKENLTNNLYLNKNENEKEKEKEKDPALHIIVSHREISIEEETKAGILIIKEEEGNILHGKELKIKASGMEGGRGKKDGVTIFGIDNNNHKFNPDFILNCQEQIDYPYIFAIYYQKETQNYFIRSYSGIDTDKKILYIKLNENYNLPLKEKEILTAGNFIFQINLLEDNKIEIINLSRIDFSEQNKQIFDPNTCKEISIGRDKNCIIRFPNDKSLSRNQTTFYYNDYKKEWVIYDGNKNKNSTNGTWVFGTHSFIVKNQMIVEILNSKLKFILKENDI